MEVTLTNTERLHLIECLKCGAVMQGGSTEFQRQLLRKLETPDRKAEYERLKKEFVVD